LFYVLVGARMPSVLVEMFFITNKTEGREMARSRYQDAVVNALYQGVKEYNQSVLAMKTL
jgi:N-acetylmuramoyl-L-alanine amidase